MASTYLEEQNAILNKALDGDYEIDSFNKMSLSTRVLSPGKSGASPVKYANVKSKAERFSLNARHHVFINEFRPTGCGGHGI